MSSKNKRLIDQYRQQAKSIIADTYTIPNENIADKQKRITKLLTNYTAFISYYFPSYATAPLADFHISVTSYILKNQRCFVAVEWARDHAKSSTMWMLALMLALKKEASTVVFVSKSYAAAEKLLEPLKKNIESNARLIDDFGDMRAVAHWTGGDILTTTGVNFVAMGRGQSPRGLRNDAIRPDLIIVDDIDDDELVENTSRVDKAWDWLMSALFLSQSISGSGRFVVTQNNYAEDSLIGRAVKKAIALKAEGMPAYHQRVNILDNTGKPNWWQRFTAEDCAYMIKSVGYIVSQREYFNNPIRSGKHFKPQYIQYKPLAKLHEYPVIISYCDPSFSERGDSKAIILIGYKDGEFHVIKAFCDQAAINDMIRWHYELDEYCRQKKIACRHFMEAVFYQKANMDMYYADYAKNNNLPALPIAADRRAKPQKQQRLLALTSYFESGRVFFNEAEKENRHTANLVAQLLAFNPPRKTQVDGVDALEGAIFILKNSTLNYSSAISIVKKKQNTSKYY